MNSVDLYGSDLVDMTSYGKFLFLLPLILSPIVFILALQILSSCLWVPVPKGKLRIIPGYVLICLALALTPSFANSVLSSRYLDSIDISRHNLNGAGIQKLQSLEESSNAFPFVVRFHWQPENIRVVFGRSKGRDQIVREIMSGALTGKERSIDEPFHGWRGQLRDGRRILTFAHNSRTDPAKQTKT